MKGIEDYWEKRSFDPGPIEFQPNQKEPTFLKKRKKKSDKEYPILGYKIRRNVGRGNVVSKAQFMRQFPIAV